MAGPARALCLLVLVLSAVVVLGLPVQTGLQNQTGQQNQTNEVEEKEDDVTCSAISFIYYLYDCVYYDDYFDD